LKTVKRKFYTDGYKFQGLRYLHFDDTPEEKKKLEEN
jgi:hypothetical protein